MRRTSFQCGLITASIAVGMLTFITMPLVAAAEEFPTDDTPSLVPLTGELKDPFGQAQRNIGQVQAKSGVGGADLEVVIGNVIQGALSLVGVLFFGYMVWAGYLWMTAHGEEEKITKAKGMLKHAIIGLAVTLAAYAVSVFVVEKLIASGTLAA